MEYDVVSMRVSISLASVPMTSGSDPFVPNAAIVCNALHAVLVPRFLTVEDGILLDPLNGRRDETFGDDPPCDKVDAKSYPSEVALDVPT